MVSGRLQFKLDEEVLDVEGGSAVRVAPEVVRSVWNEGPDDAQVLIFSLRVADVREDAEIVENFWPDRAPRGRWADRRPRVTPSRDGYRLPRKAREGGVNGNHHLHDTETGQITGTKDKDYNIIWFVEQCLSNALRLEIYINDAEREGDSELADFFRRAQSESRKGAEKGKQLLAARIAA